LVFGSWSLADGLWSLVFGLWFLVFGLWQMGFGAWALFLAINFRNFNLATRVRALQYWQENLKKNNLNY
jgi:hypothetical protein